MSRSKADLIARREGSAGIIRLNRPKAINAVTLEMFRDIDKALDRFEADPEVAVIVLEGAGERGLCAGGDIRALWESSKVKGDLGKDPVARGIHPQRPDREISKALCRLHGRHRDGRRGRAFGARCHRVVTERTRLAMPEVGLGFFPDVGGTFLLSRSPGEIGTYFGLTGQTMNGPDAIHARFADAVVPSSKLPALREALTKIRPGATSAEIKTLIDGFATGETAGPVAAKQARIDGWFAHDRMEDIVAALQRDGSELAQSTLKTLGEKSPRGMVVTLKLLRLARGLVLAGRMPGAGISRRTGSLCQRRFSRGRARRRDRQGPQSKMVAAADRGRDAGNGRALFRRDRCRRIEVRLNQRKARTGRKSRWQISHSSASAIWAGRWRPIWSRPATR